jgi:hypothetical protein
MPSFRRLQWLLFGLCGFGFCTIVVPAEGGAGEIIQYSIAPGSRYTFKPSPWVGIPGGLPSEYQLDFDVSGTLAIEFNDSSTATRILAAEITLSGNESIQTGLPNELTPVTAALVAEYLESRLFQEYSIAAEYLEYSAEQPTGLRLRAYADGVLGLSGGFDNTFLDGGAMLFDFTASAVPEPIALMLLCFGSVCFLRRRLAC